MTTSSLKNMTQISNSGVTLKGVSIPRKQPKPTLMSTKELVEYALATGQLKRHHLE